MSFKILQQIIILGLAIAAVFLYIQPKFLELRTLQAETSEYAEAVERATEFNQLLNSLLNKVNAISGSDLRAVEQFLPASVDGVAVARDIETIAERNNMIVGNIAFVETSAVEPVQRVQEEDFFDPDAMDGAADTVPLPTTLSRSRFQVSVRGEYDELVGFLEALEANAYPLNVVSLGLSGGADAEAATSLYAFDLVLETYSSQPTM
ncbi:hypothetical protein CL655_03240 [bacterium]|nr:hypothetical protein [bacterium]